MALALTNEIARIAAVDLFRRGKAGDFETGLFVARLFYLDYDRAYLLVADAWKQRAKGIPQGTFLLAYYENEDGITEALLLRVLRPTRLPTDSDVIASMIEYYKDNLRTAGRETQREGQVVGSPTDIRLGKVRYSSARRFQAQNDDVPVFVSQDFLGKRTALTG